jgi:uncharacterized protein (TIGR00725 family)
MKLRLGIMGAASGPIIESPNYRKKAYLIGKAVAEHNCFLVNGACPGLPDEAARGAKEAGGFCIGLSPAFSEREHADVYKSPIEHHDLIIYTGFGLMERDILNIRTSSGIIILGGGIGTLNEFTVAYDEGVPIGILLNCGGISNYIPKILQICRRKITKNMIFESNPEKLVLRLIKLIESHPRPHYEDERVKEVKRNKAVKVHR